MNRSQLTRRAALVITALFSFSFVSAHGDSVVNSTGDGGLVYGGKYGCETDLLRGGVCTLRAAIEYANLNPDVDTITFSIPATAPSTINLGSALPDLSTDININGPGAKVLTVQRYSGSYRIFNVTTNGTVSLSALTIAQGSVPDTGGAIQNAGSASVTISKCTIRNNYAGTGGAVFNSSAGTLTINNSTLSDNESAEGGAIHNAGKLNISGTTVRHNLAIFQGGGLNNLGDATLTNTTIADNRIIFNQGNSFSIV